MVTALTRQDLDAAQCAVPGCTSLHPHPLQMRSLCHPRAALSVAYDKDTGWLIVQCAQCDAMVARVAVAAARSSR
jgi:hypothetical protein